MDSLTPRDLAGPFLEGLRDLDDRLGIDTRSLLLAVLRLLLRGNPVPVEDVAREAGVPASGADRFLEHLGAERDARGRIVGLGITLERTPHRYRIGDRDLYTWCAGDALVFPALLGHRARVSSVDPTSGETVTVVLGPQAVEEVSPPESVASWVHPTGTEAPRERVCAYGRLFASEANARAWLNEHRPEGLVVPLEIAHAAGRLVREEWQGVFHREHQ